MPFLMSSAKTRLIQMSKETVLQWNCRGFRANKEDLELLCSDFSPVALCLQETKVTTSETIEMTGYNTYCVIPDPHFPSGGSAILISKSYPQRQVQLNTQLQAVAVNVTINTPVTICSLYLPPAGEDKPKVSVKDLENVVKQLPKPYILLGDMNAHNRIWGSKKTDERGRTIEKLIDQKSLCLFNTKAATYQHAATGTLSSIDLTLCHPTIFTDYQWQVHDDLCGSDHYPIIIQTRKNNTNNDKNPSWKINRADWDEFKRLCQDSFLPLNQAMQEESPSDYFTRTLLDVSNRCIGKTSKSPSKKSKPWFNEECQRSRKERRAAQNRFKSNFSPANMEKLLQAKAKTKLILKEAQRESFRQFVKSLSPNTPMRKVWKAIKRMNGDTSTTVHHLKKGNKPIETKEDIAEALASQFAEISSSQNYTEGFSRHKTKAEQVKLKFNSNNNEHYNTEFSSDELHHALLTSKDSSPGPDDVHYQMLKHLPEEQLVLLLAILNDIWSSGIYPPSWSEATVIPIPKPGKDHSNTINYRPIAMTSCMAKTMERMVNNRLVWYLESNNLLNPYQSGFRHQRSTTDHLVRLERYIRDGFAQKEHTVAVFFDLEKAYDTTWKYGILKDVHDMGLRGRLPIFISKFLTNRSFSVRLGSTLSAKREQEMGVPQGCVLSVTLFGIKINSITRNLRKDLNCSLYVDDFVMCYRSKNMPTIERQLQQAIKHLETWTMENGFKFSQTKTTCVHFCQKRGCKDKPVLTLHNTEIAVADEVKFLGMIFDRKLSFEAHIEYLRRKCQPALNLLKVLSHKEWGADKEILLTLYKTYVLSRLDYGSIVYGSATETRLKRLDPIQNQGLRLCLGAFRTSPIKSIEVESNIPPLELRREMLSLRYATKTKANGRNPTHDDIFKSDGEAKYQGKPTITRPYSVRVRTQIGEVGLPLKNVREIRPPDTPPWLIAKPSVNLDLSKTKKADTDPEIFKKNLKIIENTYKDHVPIYTDGSKDNERVGYGVNTPSRNLSGRLHPKASIFTAEASALLEAVEWMDGNNDSKFTIFSDSKSCLQAMLQHMPAST